MRVVLLAGGVGGARFTRGLRDLGHAEGLDLELTVVVNTGDDMWLDALRVCPDLDTVMYTLGGVVGDQGWGRAGESRRVTDELHAYGLGWEWFTLGDLDLGTHLARTELLRSGMPLSQVTERLCERWQPGARLLPMSDDEVETWVEVERDDEVTTIHFEEWWVRHRAALPARRFVQRGVGGARPAPGVLEAIAAADLVILPPSNPVVSIGTILGVPGIRDAVRHASAPVVGVSPIVGGAPVRGMADACLVGDRRPDLGPGGRRALRGALRRGPARRLARGHRRRRRRDAAARGGHRRAVAAPADGRRRDHRRDRPSRPRAGPRAQPRPPLARPIPAAGAGGPGPPARRRSRGRPRGPRRSQGPP